MQAFNVHINGVYHCSLRYRLFYDFQQEVNNFQWCTAYGIVDQYNYAVM